METSENGQCLRWMKPSFKFVFQRKLTEQSKEWEDF